MKKLIINFAIFINFNSILLSKDILIIDTYCNDKYAYNTFNSLARNASFKPEHINFYNLIDKNITHYDGVFILVSPNFMNNTTNPIVKNVIKKVTEYSTIQGKLIGVIFPNNTMQESQLLNAKKIIQKLNLLDYNSRGNLKNIINFFLKINLAKKHNYATAIEFTPKALTAEEEEKLKQEKEELETIVVIHRWPEGHRFKLFL